MEKRTGFFDFAAKVGLTKRIGGLKANENKKLRFTTLGLTILAVVIVAAVFIFTGNPIVQFKGPASAGEPLTEVLIANLDQYVAGLMAEFEVPGASMVLVHGGKVVHARGFGVRDLETGAPVDTRTLFGIGSTTKSMTAVMMASLVEDGVIRWDTPLTEILPTFALSDPEITKKMTVRHTLCMCSSVPDHKEAISVSYSETSAEDVIEMLAAVPLSGSFERTFNYSSPMVATGGYLAAMAAGGKYGSLAQAYADIMQERVFDPLGMTTSTFSIDKAIDSDNYATPHYSSMAGFNAIPPRDEGVFTPLAPAGALWSNADDLGKYLVMLLNHGAAANGQRVISDEKLAYLWKPQISIDGKMSYGLGWDVEETHGLTIVHHPGGTAGFGSELVVIPDLDIGFALLLNRMDLVRQLGRMTTYRLLEMLTGSEPAYDQKARKAILEIDQQVSSLSQVTRETVDPDKIAPFLGSYRNDELGEVKLALHDDHTLWVDFGEYESPVRPLALEEDQYIFYESIFLGKTIQLRSNGNGVQTMQWSGNEATYFFGRESQVK